MARIRAVLRRITQEKNIPEQYSFGIIKLDFKKYRLSGIIRNKTV